ncbi:MAG: VOC family protein [Tannerellaceae bacterium]|jgi:lactoylglutathione lyase|nr:VOC family protein [Tannerellaceae bacterium]
MKIKGKFAHFNIDVTDLDRSLTFYSQALGLTEKHRKTASDGSFILVYLADGESNFLLELTWLRDHPQAYELGENESHLAFTVDNDYEATREYHREMGWICYENHSMGIYFIADPDDYWIEILPH